MVQAHTHALLSLSFSCQFTTTLRSSQSARRADRKSVGWARRGNSWPPLSTCWGYLAWRQTASDWCIAAKKCCMWRVDGWTSCTQKARWRGKDSAREPLRREVGRERKKKKKPFGWVSLKASQSSLHQTTGAGGMRVDRFNGANKAHGDRWHHPVGRLATRPPRKRSGRGAGLFHWHRFLSQLNCQVVRETGPTDWL